MYKIPCYKHEGSYVQFINTDKEKTQFICDQCQQDLFDLNPNFNFQNLINLNRGLKSPEFLFSKLEVSGDIRNFFGEYSKHDDISLNNQIKQFESLITEIQNGFIKMIDELQQNIKLFLDTKQIIRLDLEQIIKFNDFKQIMNKLVELGDSINPKAIEQAETDVHQYFQYISKDCKQLLIENIQENYQRNKQKIKNEETFMFSQFKRLESLFQSIIFKHNEFTKQLQPIPPKSYILSDQFYDRIISQIEIKSKKKILDSNLIFKGSRDGLNANSFWKCCNQKSNLLMIFKSYNKSIFGGYSPCKWVGEQYITHISDPTYSTFLFSQDKNEIYDQKDGFQNSAICCNIQGGPIFGAGHDLYIGNDFVDGYSKLGRTFKNPQLQQKNVWSFMETQEQSSYLFGQLTPNIVECQIFEITFQ
ncbi:unnamed protein product [Paramecium primaurelia]|uniref:TLDc domain-containing protein n=1 Tax=Paramecium primaurelia TaxID=5886 RepID=A0A8S1KL88_PARPR|nr:unnamed protein product [Paramecium primaurelia]